MARTNGVWGIEIGQSALKALRCSYNGSEVVAEAFDYIEYPKILSQPEADPEELIGEAIQKFLERNDSRTQKICLSVPGQSGLAKFFKPPPVEVKKVADIVRYEARQQIPFDLNDVVWDYQMMPGSTIEEGYALESEVGLFAIKREMVYRQLEPLDAAGLEVDVVQLAPIAIYNMLAYDRMHERVENDIFDVDNPPSSSVLLSIGTDSSDLLVTNGFRIWQRSMPIGGNHFTRQLIKDLKLTFSNAEHLKRNAREAVDPKMVFQTMRPVFNDLVTEVQRSIGFFRSLNRKAEINELLVTGNTVKMPGLAAYLGKNLGFEVHVLDRFNRLAGDDVLTIPTFRDNAPTFAVCYGLCLQGLGLSQIHASLVPREIVVQRIIRAKKPWTVAACATLMAGMVGHYAFTERSWAKTHPDLWTRAGAAVEQMNSYSTEQFSKDDELTSKLNYLSTLGTEVASTSERRLMWLEVIKALNAAVPRAEYPDGKPPSPKVLPYEDRTDIHITSLDAKRFEDLSQWYAGQLPRRHREEEANWRRIMGVKAPEVGAEAAPDASVDGAVAATGPTGPGWVFELKGYHYFNSPKRKGLEGSNHVRKFLITNLKQKPIELPNAEGKLMSFLPEELGLQYPLMLNERQPQLTRVPNPDYNAEEIAAKVAELAAAGTPVQTIRAGMTLPDGTVVEPQTLEVLRHDFIVQIVWIPSTLSDRLKARAEKEATEQQEAPLDDPNAVAANP
jgi:type IV pilus assembly protein PilM